MKLYPFSTNICLKFKSLKILIDMGISSDTDMLKCCLNEHFTILEFRKSTWKNSMDKI